VLLWTRSVIQYPDVFPMELSPERALGLQASGVVLGAAAFAAAGGRGSARLGAAFALILSALGWCASRWPELSRAIDLCGGIFAGPFIAGVLSTAFALTAACVAAALLLKELRPNAAYLALAAAALWAVPTAATEAALTRWWGLGPRTLAQAAGVPTGEDAQIAAVIRLAPNRARSTSRESVRMSGSLQDVRRGAPPSLGVDLSPTSLAKLETFLERAGYRGVFAEEALNHVRRGWLMWWDADRALDAMMVSVPGRAHPDYRGALDLIKVGPLTAERFTKLEQLDAAAKADPRSGFEDVTVSQYIFEGFVAAYARFDDEPKAREWMAHIGNLFLVMEKKVEISQLEDFREGRVTGTLNLDGRPAGSVMVGLFEVWRSTPAAAGVRLLSGSTFPDENGHFSFSSLGPGQYELALLGRIEDLRGRVLNSPGRFEIGYDRPQANLPPIDVERDVLPTPQAYAPGGLPEAPTPETPEPPLLWRKK
jgi:hypothetical protein